MFDRTAPFKASNDVWITLNPEGGFFASNDPDDYDSGFDFITPEVLVAWNEFNAQYDEVRTDTIFERVGIELDVPAMNSFWELIAETNEANEQLQRLVATVIEHTLKYGTEPTSVNDI